MPFAGSQDLPRMDRTGISFDILLRTQIAKCLSWKFLNRMNHL